MTMTMKNGLDSDSPSDRTKPVNISTIQVNTRLFPGEGAALLWDEKFQKKPAYDGFLKGIKGGK